MSVSATPSSDPRDDLLAHLAEVVHLVTGRAPAEVTPERTFVDDLRVDSLAMVEILEGLASRLGVHIEDEAAKGFVRVGDLLGYLGARQRA